MKYSLKDVCIFNIQMNDKVSWSIPKCEHPLTISTELHFLEVQTRIKKWGRGEMGGYFRNKEFL